MNVINLIFTNRKFKTGLIYAFIFLPVIISVFLVCRYGVNVPFGDEWSIVTLYKNIKDYGLHFDQFFAQHNEHRIFFPRIILLIVALLTRWNVVVQMLVSQGLLISVAVLLCKYLTGRYGLNRSILLSFVPIVTLVFSLRQWENMYWGFQVGFFMVYAFSIYSFYLYDKYENTKEKKYLYSCWTCAFIASFSSIHGLIVWVCYGMLFSVLWIFEKKRIGKEQLITFLIGLISWGIYFLDYTKPAGHPSLAEGGIRQLLRYFLVSMGGSVFPKEKPALAFGAVLVLILAFTAIWLIWKKKTSKYILPSLLILFSVGVLASITVGRAGFGASQGLSSRYTTYSLLIPIGLYIIFYREMKSRAEEKVGMIRKNMNTMIVIFSIVAFAVSLLNIPEILNQSASRQYAKFVLSRFDTMPNEIKTVFFPIDNDYYLNTLPKVLKTEEFSVFAEDQVMTNIPNVVFEEEPTPGLVCGIGEDCFVNIEDHYLVIKNAWAVDDLSKNKAEAVCIKINDLYFPAYYGIPRPDVAEHFGKWKYTNSGFEASIPMDKLREGNNSITVQVIGRNGQYYYESEEFIFYKKYRDS